MTKTTEPNAKQSTADTKAVDKNTAVKDKPITKTRSGLGFFKALRRMFSVAILIGTISAGWLFWKDWQIQIQVIDNNSSVISSLSSAVSIAKNQSQLAISQQRQQQQTSQQLVEQIKNLQMRVNAQGLRLVELGATTRSDWLLAEAEYLARLAKQRLQTERSVKSALGLLESVDAILIQLDDPNILDVRSVVAADITRLRLTSDIDREGIYLELQALAKSVESLALTEFTQLNISIKESTETLEVEEQSVMPSFLADLASLVRVRQRQIPIEPMLHQQEEQIVRRNLYMMFEQAQVALLREEQSIYRATLLRAQNYLQRFFQSNPSNQVLYKRLEVLLGTDIVQQLPKIYKSLEAIQGLLIVREQRLFGGDEPKQVEPEQ